MRLAAAILTCLLLACVAATAATDSNQQAAVNDAASLLAAAAVPPDAARLDSEPAGDGGALSTLPMAFIGAPREVVTQGEFFHSLSTAADVVAWLHDHAPSGTTLKASGSADTVAGRGIDFLVFERPPIAHVLSTRWLILSVAALDDGGAGIRADAYVVWTRTRSAGMAIHGARDLVINVGKRKIHVTDARRVQRIAQLFNSLDLVETGDLFCMVAPPNTPHPRLSFRNRTGGKLLAYAHVRPVGCPRADMVVGGQRYDSLALSGPAGTKLLAELRNLGALPAR